MTELDIMLNQGMEYYANIEFELKFWPKIVQGGRPKEIRKKDKRKCNLTI